MRAHVHVRDRLFDLRHMTRDAFASRARLRVTRVRLERRFARTELAAWCVTLEAHCVSGRSQLRLIFRAVNVVTTETRDTMSVHGALDEVVALHPILVRGAVRKVSEGRLAELVIFEPPKILQRFAHLKTNRPVEGSALDWIRERSTLRMTLDARVVRGDVIET